jgi:hypothetical protein
VPSPEPKHSYIQAPDSSRRRDVTSDEGVARTPRRTAARTAGNVTPVGGAERSNRALLPDFTSRARDANIARRCLVGKVRSSGSVVGCAAARAKQTAGPGRHDRRSGRGDATNSPRSHDRRESTSRYDIDPIGPAWATASRSTGPVVPGDRPRSALRRSTRRPRREVDLSRGARRRAGSDCRRSRPSPTWRAATWRNTPGRRSSRSGRLGRRKGGPSGAVGRCDRSKRIAPGKEPPPRRALGGRRFPSRRERGAGWLPRARHPPPRRTGHGGGRMFSGCRSVQVSRNDGAYPGAWSSMTWTSRATALSWWPRKEAPLRGPK